MGDFARQRLLDNPCSYVDVFVVLSELSVHMDGQHAFGDGESHSSWKSPPRTSLTRVLDPMSLQLFVSESTPTLPHLHPRHSYSRRLQTSSELHEEVLWHQM